AGMEALRPIIEASHGEQGCMSYALHRDASNPDRFVLVEVWRSQADLDAHFGMPYLAGMGDIMSAHLAEPPTIVFCTPEPLGDPNKGVL
ncbi:MAG: putative quinol monooxygenase, partial [Actinomycetota bacterium]